MSKATRQTGGMQAFDPVSPPNRRDPTEKRALGCNSVMGSDSSV
jgi:hypothetical protein